MLTDAEQYQQPIQARPAMSPSISEGARRQSQGEDFTVHNSHPTPEQHLAGHLSSRVQHVASNEYKGIEAAAPPDQAINTPVL